jgi:hypothetical protein
VRPRQGNRFWALFALFAFFILCLILLGAFCIVGGIWVLAFLDLPENPTGIKLFGMELTTAVPGIVVIFIGVAILFLAYRLTAKTLEI